MVKVVTKSGKTFEFKTRLSKFAVNSQANILKIEVEGGNFYYFPITSVDYFISNEGHPFWEKIC